MKPAPFEYFAPRAIDEALELLQRHGGDARPLAGGQSLVPMLAFRLARPAALIDLNRIEPLAGIRLDGDAVVIGAMTRQAAALVSPLVAQYAPLLIRALRHVGHPPTRARGTIGGSLSHADPAAELPVAMVALGAEMVVRSQAGSRTVPAGEFFRGAFETALAPGELLAEIRIPRAGSGHGAFHEISLRKGDFAIASAAAMLSFDDGGRCDAARLVLGGVGGAPVRCLEAERILTGRRADPAVIREASAAMPAERFELDSHAASRAYRLRIAPVLAARALSEAAAQGGGRAP